MPACPARATARQLIRSPTQLPHASTVAPRNSSEIPATLPAARAAATPSLAVRCGITLNKHQGCPLGPRLFTARTGGRGECARVCW